MEEMEREYIDVEIDGEIKKLEHICTIESERDSKQYILMTEDENIGEEVNVIIGELHEFEDAAVIDIIDDEDELDYVKTLIDKIERSE